MVKKIWLFVLLLSVFSFSLVWVSADYDPSSLPFIQALEKNLDKKSNLSSKKNYLEQIVLVTQMPVFKKEKSLQILLVDLHSRAQSQQQQLQKSDAGSQIKSSENRTWIDLAGVDGTKVAQSILDRHNQARSKAGLAPYRYHSELERSATAWAKSLAQKNQATHTRSAGDGYYNYSKIQNRFSDLGIKFEQLGGGLTSFTESIGYRSYRCSSNCDQALLDSAKKSFDRFLSEGANGAHYKAIMSSHFKQIGVGFAVSNRQAYMVIHYGLEILE